MTDSSIFFPLKSNLEWFRGRNKYSLENRIKQALLLYDELIFEAGTYICAVSDEGDIDFHFPIGSLSSGDREKMDFGEVEKMSLSIKNDKTKEEAKLIDNSDVKRMWGADFLNLFEELFLKDYEFIKLKEIRLNKQGKEIVKKTTKSDLDNFDIKPEIKGGYFLKKKMIKGLNHSLLLSSALNKPVLIDDTHQSFLIKKSQNSWTKPFESGRIEALERVTELVIPDFSSLSIGDLIDLREDRAWRDFREKIEEINNEISETPNSERFRQKTQRLLFEDLLEEIKEMAPDDKSIALDVFLGSIPYIGQPISTAKDVYSAYKHSRSWVSFLMTLRETYS